jgi:hypothetical protein
MHPMVRKLALVAWALKALARYTASLQVTVIIPCEVEHKIVVAKQPMLQL